MTAPTDSIDLREIAGAWSLPEPLMLRAATGGINNLTQFVETAGGRYVLRLYQNTRDVARVRYEHAILLGLSRQELSFRVPTPLLAAGGDTLATLGDGTLAALFPVLPGGPIDRSDPAQIRNFGAALAELHPALAALDVQLPALPMPSYGDPVLPYMPEPWEVARQPLLETLVSRAKIDHLACVARDLQQDVRRLYDPLPVQICHNDCGPGNALAVDGRVSAILDFEFAGPDRRAIDVAVGWYWSVGPAWGSGNELPVIRAFLEGYCETSPLSAAEIEAMPCLARLQRFVSVVHWVGRHLAGTSNDERTREQVQRLLDLDRWLTMHEAEYRAAVSV